MAKSEHPFDQHIKEKLKAFSERSNPDWNYMQQKLDEEVSDNLFDQKIKDLLDPVEADSSKIHWELFAAKRKQQTERQLKIVQARVIESALFLFLL